MNLDFALVELLREVKYLNLLGLSIPVSAQSIYVQIDLFRNYTGIMDLIINKYNWICENMIQVERNLLDAKMKEIGQNNKQEHIFH